MSLLTIVLSLLALGSAILTITAKFSETKKQEYIFKPLTMIWIILIAILADDPVSTTYQVLILLGLLASIVGDVMLIDPRRFVYGLVSFLIAHIFYIIAFTAEGDASAPIWYIIPFALYGVAILRWLWPDLGEMKVPVMIYVLAIMIMAWQAANRWIEVRETGPLCAMIGAYLFVFSDSVLAVEHFRETWRTARILVLGSYFAAQWLIALSI
ncbi:MAG: lysoplasmalogenase [Anaerolineae bacterium]|nr:lysoplasmalogenase [Anaerolineae bacterium]